ncbi:MAG: AbrB/MazE/SpoVT family DNA-binding domain-containing protein [Candidatus Altiarchaeales archaeon]|nr:AbrB/MazE/SpoVT family DNA-binding domain-containing protein [Candidatus Altiarchaeales archaeon]
MDARKIQETGGSSYIITLPKRWVEDNHIKKKQPVGLTINSDGSLTITPTITDDVFEKTLRLDADQFRQQAFLFRMLVSAYFMGYTRIQICSKTKLTPAQRDAITDFIQTAIGPEVMRETDRELTIKDLLKPDEMPIENTVSRLQILVSSMHEEAVKSYLNGKTKLAWEVVNQDKEIDRLYWLVARQYHMVLRQNVLAKNMKSTLHEAAFYFEVSRKMERMGDHAVKIAKQTSRFKPKKELRDEIMIASRQALEMFENSIKSWFKKDLEKANHVIDSKKQLLVDCDNLTAKSLKLRQPRTTAAIYVTESIKRTGLYSANISESVLDYLIHNVT